MSPRHGHGHGRASGFHTRRHIARLARGLADILSNRRAREHWLLPGRLGTVQVWFNANRTLHECGCACAGAWVKACAVGACGWGASFVRSTAVRYRTVTSDVNAAFFARRWVPLGVNCYLGGTTTFIPGRAEGQGVSRDHARDDGGAPCATPRVREGGAAERCGMPRTAGREMWRVILRPRGA